MSSTSSRRSLLNYLGIAILLVGMGTGEFIYWRSLRTADQPSDTDLLLTAETSRLYERTVETNVGTFGLIMIQFTHAMKEPRTLAMTIGAVSAVVAGGCFWIASKMPRG